MGMPSSDDVVLIEPAKNSGDPTVVTVNCPDQAGLGCDLCRIILEFGLSISRADFSTDGRWCYIVFWVVPHSTSHKVNWDSLKNRLSCASPPCLGPFYFDQKSNVTSVPSLYLLKFCFVDRKGLLHDVAKILTELEFTIQRVKVMTTPDGKVVDLFFITDGLDLLHTEKRRSDTCRHLASVFKECCISCELQLAGPEYESLQAFSSLPLPIAEELFSCEQLEEKTCSQALCTDTIADKATVTVDNNMSPAHTLLQLKCIDQKGLFYDILRTSKDCNIRVAYGRFSSSLKGYRNMDLFIQQTDGKKIMDPKHQLMLCSRLKAEMLRPFRVIIANRGPDTELLVANPVELSGKGRPRVFYDVTLALKTLGICIFSAEIARHSTQDQQWEVYRFLLNENCEVPLASAQARKQIVDRVKKTLMGW
ncbi:ACT domain-containing protein ACR9 [Ricinus communis]|uniref:ACT domain-containing protein ACR n=1 Tax=Ricinus communis TaxID=3988 RepID=B9SR22_RICCO|nr:ACT domain-containing protein ACR9 [Ricinus communis]EEF33924.1 amino acid binding protein, putative [Ricinus communis]|eukprot:XP_002528441.1 ACT domain-containing protein ACR9 [Ricinus communis]